MSEHEEREEGPLAISIIPTIPAHPRPGTVTIVATNSEYGRWKLTRVGLTADDAIQEELDDYKAGLAGSLGRGISADDYARDQPDVALWSGERLLAVVLPRVGGDPEVTRFDQAEDFRPMPTTLWERNIVGLAREYGVEECRQAILEKFLPNHNTTTAHGPLTKAEDSVLYFMRTIGEQEAMDRLFFAGPYEVIREAVGRLGRDAVAELRRQVEAGKLAS